MSINLEIARQAAVRWREHRVDKDRNEAKIKTGEIVDIESPQRIKARLDRVSMNAAREPMRSAEVASANEARITLPGQDTSLISKIGLERIIGKSDFLNVSFLEQALAVSRFVGRINIKLNRTHSVGFGTGFMVSPRLLLTNNHVLSTAEDAVHSEVEFDYQYDRFGRLLPVVNYSLQPNKFFLTNSKLDFTLVAVGERSVRNDVELTSYGWCRLIGEEGKALIGDSLNIIQHPRGEAKQISLRSNRLLNLFDEFAHYETDTEPGSSGSPVYNDQWEVVALHHSGVPKTDNGNFIAVDGSIWRDGIDRPDTLDWVANEGIRVSSIVKHIREQDLPTEQANLRRDMFELEPPHPIVAAIRAEEEAKRRSGEQTGKIFDRTSGATLQTSPNGVSFTIPLYVSIALGAPEATQNSSGGNAPIATAASQPHILSPDNSAPSMPDPHPEPLDPLDLAEFQMALRELEDSNSRPYYDRDGDREARSKYYQNIDVDQLDGEGLYFALRDLLKKTHRTPMGYRPASHVYPWVDLQEVGGKLKLKSIYSGKEFNAKDFIEADFRVEQERRKLSNILLRESSFSVMERERQLNLLEASLPFNCEHVVPQSWFMKKEPMRGDLHHLFACEVGCNSFRSNIPYFDFLDSEEAVREACGRREENKFEPSAGKGTVARATLYFLLRYPSEINQTIKEYKAERLPTLLSWHQQHPVDRYELHRNAAIHEKQGNRNPLIDFPEWANLIDFSLGLG